MSNLKITFYLTAPVAGEIPYLEAILTYQLALKQNNITLNRASNLKEIPVIDLPLAQKTIGGTDVYKSSAPIFNSELVLKQNISKSLDDANLFFLDKNTRKKISMVQGAYKSMYKPILLAQINKIVYFAVGNKGGLNQALEGLVNIGTYRKIGYGIIHKWDIQEIDDDYSWYYKHKDNTILMRRLPFCHDLPSDLLGYKRDYKAIKLPFWHPDNQCEVVEPC